jgi:hypothetical protein
MPEEERYWIPGRTYDIQVKIKDLDYTQDIKSISIQSSLATAYQVVTFVMLIDPNDIILNDVFGVEPIKLSIRLLGYTESEPSDQLDFELMYLKSEFNITERTTLSSEGSNSSMNERTEVRITTVARQPFITMTTVVNGVYLGTTVNDVVQDLVNQITNTPRIEFDSDGRNSEPIDQVCVPPITLYNAIKESDHNSRMDNLAGGGYLDSRFGLFDGVPGIFCQYDNTIKIKNLTRRLSKNQAFTVYQFSDDSNQTTNRVIDQSKDGKTFYTYQRVFTDYSGNAKFASLATTLNHIIKPLDTLAAILQQDLEEVSANHSLVYQNSRIHIDKRGVARTKFYNEDTGYGTNATQFNSWFGRQLADLSTISLQLEKDLPILNLVEVGEAVKFKPQTIEYADLGGKYILWSSRLDFFRRGDWASVATINLMRTNKKI